MNIKNKNQSFSEVGAGNWQGSVDIDYARFYAQKLEAEKYQELDASIIAKVTVGSAGGNNNNNSNDQIFEVATVAATIAVRARCNSEMEEPILWRI